MLDLLKLNPRSMNISKIPSPWNTTELGGSFSSHSDSTAWSRFGFMSYFSSHLRNFSAIYHTLLMQASRAFMSIIKSNSTFSAFNSFDYDFCISSSFSLMLLSSLRTRMKVSTDRRKLLVSSMTYGKLCASSIISTSPSRSMSKTRLIWRSKT